MRKKNLIILVVFMLLFQGCGNISHKEIEVEKQQEINEVNNQRESAESVESNSISSTSIESEKQDDGFLPDGFIKASDSDLESISNSNIDNLVDVSIKVLRSIGVTDINEAIYGNYERDENEGIIMINVDVFTVTDLKNLIVSFMYLDTSQISSSTPSWSIVSVKDANTGNYYYVPDELKNMVDLYDYKTGKLKEQEETKETITNEETTKVSELKINEESIIDITMRDMTEWYNYIDDVIISVDENNKIINIIVQIPTLTDNSTAKIIGKDVARYLAANATSANSYFESPGSDNIGGLYKKYNLLIYVDDGYKTFDLYGGKVTTAKEITWN